MNLTGNNILVTGAGGFIGSHLVEILAAAGCQVRALAQYNSFNSWGWLDTVECRDDIEVITGDIRDPECCRTILDGIDVVFNLAALIAIPYSYNAPRSYIDTNINGALNVCQAARSHSDIRIIQTSTSEVYGTAQYVPIDESHPLQPQSPYSASKIGADAVAMSFYNSFEVPVTIARPFNTYGPRQSNRAVIPTIISQLASGNTELSLGDLTPTRDFNFVSDTCSGLIAVAESDDTIGETVNIGSNSEASIAETLAVIQDIMGTAVPVKADDQRVRPAGSEVFRLCCDNRKLLSLTDFTPKVSLKEGLEETVRWMRDPQNLTRYKTDVYNV